MLESFPVRRDPRVLVFLEDHGRIHFAALDAWEIRGLGSISPGDRRILRLALVRVILQVRPTVIVARVTSAVLGALVRQIAQSRALPLIELDGEMTERLLRQAPTIPALGRAYHELQGLAENDNLNAVQLAASALIHLDLPPRHYASPPRQPAPPPADLAARGSRPPRPTRVRHRPPARRSRRCACRSPRR